MKKLIIICRCTKHSKEFIELNNLEESECILLKTWGPVKEYVGTAKGYVVIRPYPPGAILPWILKFRSMGIDNLTRNYKIY